MKVSVVNNTVALSDKTFYAKMKEANIGIINLSELYSSGNCEEVFFREDDYKFAITTLNCFYKNNLAVIGGSGVGKTAFIRFLSKYICSVLSDFSLAEINIASLISGCSYRGEFEKKLTMILDLAMFHKVIIYFDEAHALSMTGGINTGGIDAINILKPYLTNQFRCILSTTIDESIILKNDIAFSRRFRFLELKPLSDKSHKKIITSKFGENEIVNNYFENKHDVNKPLFEIIDDIDFLISENKLKESIKHEIYTE